MKPPLPIYEMPKIVKTRVIIEGVGVDLCDTIHVLGRLWLVPQWSELPGKGWMRPVRLISLTGLRFEKLPPGSIQDYLLTEPIPKSVWNGQIPKGQEHKYLVMENPEFAFQGLIGPATLQ